MSFSIHRAERLRAAAALVAAQADADDGRILGVHGGGFLKDTFSLRHGEVADGVEDPVKREVQLALAALAGTLQASKDGLKALRIVVAPHVDDADGDVDLGVDHALLGQMLDLAPGG